MRRAIETDYPLLLPISTYRQVDSHIVVMLPSVAVISKTETTEFSSSSPDSKIFLNVY
jgi:hypothetical protein